MKRRKFIASLATAGVVSGCLSTTRGTLRPQISIVRSDYLDEYIGTLGLDPSRYTNLVGEYVKSALQELSSDYHQVKPEIKTDLPLVNEDDINSTENRPLGSWGHSTSQFLDSDELGDANLLLAKGMENNSYGGFAQYPLYSPSPSSIIFDLNPSFIGLKETIDYSHGGIDRVLALHEICHNLGLRHNAGKVEVNHQEEKVIGSPLTVGHVSELEGRNKFGQKFPEEIPTEYDTVFSTSLNDSIKPEHLTI